MQKFPKILMFIKGTVPTLADVEEAERCGFNVAYRNAEMVTTEGALEKCDGVAGAVPDRYAKAYPPAAEAIELFMQARRKAVFKPSGDSKAADVPAQAEAPESAKAKPKGGKPVVWEPNSEKG